MKKILCVLFCVAMLATASMSTAQFVSPFHVVPVIAKAPGENNTQWLSDLSISNLSTMAVDVSASFFREGRAGSVEDLEPPVVATLQPGQTRIISDVLGTWFPGEGNTKGTLMIFGEPRGSGAEEDVKLAVSSRAYNVGDPRGTFGQTVSSSFLNWIFGRGASVLTGVKQDNDFRTNVGIINLSFNFFDPEANTKFVVRTFNASGAMVAERTVEVEPFSMRQFSMPGLGVNSLAGGRTEIMIDPGTITWDPCDSGNALGLSPGLFFTYMSKVDSGTGDGEFSLGQADWTDFVVDCGEAPDDCPK